MVALHSGLKCNATSHEVVTTSWYTAPEMYHLPVLLHWKRLQPRDRQLVNCPLAQAPGAQQHGWKAPSLAVARLEHV